MTVGHTNGAGRTPATGAERLRLRLPATSANLGPGFDTLALALSLALDIEAVRAENFTLTATGRNVEICSSLDRNLLLDVYRKTLVTNRAEVVPLALSLHNEIPIGMGCGSSAAVRLAGLAFASHFGQLGWSGERILDEAARLEGHPDNVSACWLGGLTVSAIDEGRVQALKILPALPWPILLVVPGKPLATVAARSVLPPNYDRADAVFNIQRASLLPAAFAAGRGDLLSIAMQDRMHQPFRGEICPLLSRLLPLAGKGGVLGVALSGAGPSVLLVIDEHGSIAEARRQVIGLLQDSDEAELIECDIAVGAAVVSVEAGSARRPVFGVASSA